MKSELASIIACWRKNLSLDFPFVSGIANELTSHPRVSDAVDQLSGPDPKLGYYELMGDSDRKACIVCMIDDWAVSVIMDYRVDREITLSPYPMIIAPANGARLEIDIYECPAESFGRSFVGDLRLGGPVGRRTIAPGEAWATPAKGVFADIVGVIGSGDGREPAIMAVSGEPYAPYVRVFDRDGLMVSSAFSSNALNAKQFFADFLKNMTGSDFLESLSAKERADLRAFVADQLADPSEMISEALWPMVQTAANLDGSMGLRALETVAKSGHEMAPHAAAALERNLSAQGQAADA